MENKQQCQFWQLWMILALLSCILFPFTGVVAAIKMNRAKYGDYTVAKRWTIVSYILFAFSYLVVLAIMSIHFIQMLS